MNKMKPLASALILALYGTGALAQPGATDLRWGLLIAYPIRVLMVQAYDVQPLTAFATCSVKYSMRFLRTIRITT
jgi:hypothetical protein